MRSVYKITRAEMEQVVELAAIVIVKLDFIQDVEMVTKRLKKMLKWCRIDLVLLLFISSRLVSTTPGRI